MVNLCNDLNKDFAMGNDKFENLNSFFNQTNKIILN